MDSSVNSLCWRSKAFGFDCATGRSRVPGLNARLAFDAVLLAALWGGSFLFMRIGAPEFGPVPMMALRVGIAALCLLPLLAATRGLAALRNHAAPMAIVGIINSAIPFSLLTYATLSLSAGFTSILNGTAPFWSALVAYLWLGERLTRVRLFGLLIGIVGVLVLVWGRVSFKPGGDGWAIAAGLLATAFYGFAANFTKKRLAGVDALSSATGSMLGASVVLVPLAGLMWPDTPPSATAWMAVLVLAVAGTALAYLLYFRLIAGLGATRATTVTFLIPAFGMFWGWLFLGESVSASMIAGTALIIFGTSITLGLLARPLKPPA